MRIVFMGTPEFAVPSFKELAQVSDLSLVVSRPDAIRGRGKIPVASPVKIAAQELGVKVLEASRIGERELEIVRSAQPELIVVAAYGCLLPQELLNIPTLDCVNVHASLLPRWRGAAPIQRAVLADDKQVGVSIMRVVKELDAGPYCAQDSIASGDRDATELTEELAKLGAKLLIEVLPQLEAGTAKWTEQDENLVSYAHKIEKHEVLLSPSLSCSENLVRVRAATNTAPARAIIVGKGVRVLKAQVADASVRVPAASVVATKQGLFLGCANGVLELLELKPDGKGAMPAQAFAQGLRGDSLVWEHV